MAIHTRNDDDDSDGVKRERRREKIAKARYPVGYGKTPEHTRFKSGNKAAEGRRLKKQVPTILECIEDELARLVDLPAGRGRAAKGELARAIAKRWVARAVGGSEPAMFKLADLQAKHRPAADPEGNDTELSEADRAMLENELAMRAFLKDLGNGGEGDQ